MLTYSFEDRGKKPLYEALYEKIRTDIISGTLRAGEKLPSKRALASQCGVSVITVENAYAQLAAEGFLIPKARSGFYVSALYPDPGILPRDPDSGADTKKAGSTGASAAEARSADPASPGDGGPARMTVREDTGGTLSRPVFADFTSNAIPPASFPFSVWSKLMRETLSADQERILERSPSEGLFELRSAIADYLLAFRGFHADPERIIVGAGTEYLYGLLMQLFGGRPQVAVEEPGYRKVSRICEANGASVVHIPVDEQGMDVERLKASGASAAHLSPGHHFPTGVVMPIGRRLALLEWAAQETERYIIEDDYDSEFRMTGRPVPTLAGIDRTGSVIYMNTFSKSLSQTIRISYMVLPQRLMQRYHERLDFYACTVSTFEQVTLAKFISRGYFEKHINRMRNYYRGIRDGLLAEIARCGGKQDVSEEHAGLHFLLHAQTQMPDPVLMHRAEENGIRISCLSSSYDDVRSAPQHVLVMNYSALPRGKTKEAVERLYRIIG